MQFKPIWQALLSWSYSQKCLRATRFQEEEVKREKSSFTYFLFELCAFGTLLNISNTEAFSWSQGSLWMPCVRYPLDKMNKFFSGWGLDWFESRLGKYFPSVYDFRDSEIAEPPSRMGYVGIEKDSNGWNFQLTCPLRRLVGQPLGYYLSWALFALTHHDMVGRRRGASW
ncbi:hypothetical protein M9H77_23578 [Catharanthus roseus]|uniref:Uncharacterized protein n=1 Tax=Catharanthus roseus TaxID=4058 RepID=A0ACC0ATR0_CATRO|nr:hypothetical protein M9H77_23578 [Catharanthus roseus]